MSEVTRKEGNYVGYEYKDVTVNRDMESVYADSYTNFGWELEGNSTPLGGVNSVTMKFKRNRKLRNKAELARLQRQFDACASEIVALERSKAVGASAVAYIIGVIGTAFMAGSVFAVTAANPNIPLCITLAIPGFIGWILPYLCFSRIRKNKTEKVTPLMDSKYDEIYEVCEKANLLLG